MSGLPYINTDITGKFVRPSVPEHLEGKPAVLYGNEWYSFDRCTKIFMGLQSGKVSHVMVRWFPDVVKEGEEKYYTEDQYKIAIEKWRCNVSVEKCTDNDDVTVRFEENKQRSDLAEQMKFPPLKFPEGQLSYTRVMEYEEAELYYPDAVLSYLLNRTDRVKERVVPLTDDALAKYMDAYNNGLRPGGFVQKPVPDMDKVANPETDHMENPIDQNETDENDALIVNQVVFKVPRLPAHPVGSSKKATDAAAKSGGANEEKKNIVSPMPSYLWGGVDAEAEVIDLSDDDDAEIVVVSPPAAGRVIEADPGARRRVDLAGGVFGYENREARQRIDDNMDDDDAFDSRPKKTTQSTAVMPSIETKSREAKIDELNKSEEREVVTSNRPTFSNLLMGTLTQFPNNEKKIKTAEQNQAEKLVEVEKKLDADKIKEKEKLNDERLNLETKGIQQEKERQSLTGQRALIQCAEAKQEHYRPLNNSIQTQAKPSIFFLPAKHSTIQSSMDIRQKELERELAPPSGEHRDDAHEGETLKSFVAVKEEPGERVRRRPRRSDSVEKDKETHEKENDKKEEEPVNTVKVTLKQEAAEEADEVEDVGLVE